MTYIRTPQFSGRIKRYSGVWKATSRWWDQPWNTNEWDIEVEVYLDDLEDGDVAAELYADPVDTAARPLAAVCTAMSERRPLPGTAHGRVYGVRVPADRPADAFTPRMVPGRADAAAGELPFVLWYR